MAEVIIIRCGRVGHYTVLPRWEIFGVAEVGIIRCCRGGNYSVLQRWALFGVAEVGIVLKILRASEGGQFSD